MMAGGWAETWEGTPVPQARGRGSGDTRRKKRPKFLLINIIATSINTIIHLPYNYIFPINRIIAFIFLFYLLSIFFPKESSFFIYKYLGLFLAILQLM